MQWDFPHWVANSFLMSAGQDTSPNPATFHPAKHNKYGSMAFGEGKTPEQSSTDAEIIPVHEKWEQLWLLPHPQAMWLARCQQFLILFELLTLHIGWLLHGVISVYFCPFTVSILQGDAEMRNVFSGDPGTKVVGCKSFLRRHWHMFAKLGAGYRVLKWEKFPLHPVKMLAAQGQRGPEGVVMLYRLCLLNKVIVSDTKLRDKTISVSKKRSLLIWGEAIKNFRSVRGPQMKEHTLSVLTLKFVYFSVACVLLKALALGV